MAMTLAGALSVGALTVGAAQKTENVQRRYENVQVQVDGQKEIPANEPFFIGSTVYVSLRDAGQLVGAQVGWDGKSNTVQIATGNAGASSEELALLQSQLGSKNLQLATANSKIATMEEKIAKYEKELGISDDKEEDKEDDKDTSTDSNKDIDVKAVEKMLQKDYDDKYEVDWSIKVKETKDGLGLTVSYDTKKDADDFKMISKSKLDKLMEEMLKDIQSECGKVYVDGRLYESKEDKLVAEFTIDEKGKYKYTYKKSEEFTEKELKEFAKILEDKYGKLPELNFGGTYDGSSIRVREIVLVEDDGDIDFKIYTDYASMGIAKRAWENMDGTAQDKLEKHLENIQTEIEDEFDTKVEGLVYNEDKEIIAQYDGDLDIR